MTFERSDGYGGISAAKLFEIDLKERLEIKQLTIHRGVRADEDVEKLQENVMKILLIYLILTAKLKTYIETPKKDSSLLRAALSSEANFSTG